MASTSFSFTGQATALASQLQSHHDRLRLRTAPLVGGNNARLTGPAEFRRPTTFLSPRKRLETAGPGCKGVLAFHGSRWDQPASFGAGGFRHSQNRREGTNPVSNRAQSQAADLAPEESGAFVQVAGALHCVLSLGVLMGIDRALKQAFLGAGIRFPAALFGMLCIFVALLALDTWLTPVALAVQDFFHPANYFIQRYLPLFYVPSLVVLPLALRNIAADTAAKLALILGAGWVGSLVVAGGVAVFVRKLVRTETQPAPPARQVAPFSLTEAVSWTIGGIASFAACLALRSQGWVAPAAALPFFLSITVMGYLWGIRLPPKLKTAIHPIVGCALFANLGVYLLSLATGTGYFQTLGTYLTKTAGSPGAGDVLMGFLGPVILSFAFSMFRQRQILRRHAAEILSAVLLSSLFSLYSTAIVGSLAGLDPLLTRAIVPRCITVALALPIASLLEAANPPLTAGAVMLTGLLGANFGQRLMDRFGFRDPIARGLATACSAHGLGTAALASREPEALPFCALAYGLTGVISSLLCTLPAVRGSLMALTSGGALM